MIKIGRGENLAMAKENLQEIIGVFNRDMTNRSVRIIVDVDPQ